MGLNHVEMSIGHIGNPFTFYVTALMLSFSLIWACRQIPNHFELGVISYLGKNSMVVLTVHYFFISVLSTLFGYINNRIGLGNQIISFIMFVFVTLLMIPSIRLISKYLPSIVGKSERL